jgi:hypothetical protein
MRRDGFTDQDDAISPDMGAMCLIRGGDTIGVATRPTPAPREIAIYGNSSDASPYE